MVRNQFSRYYVVFVSLLAFLLNGCITIYQPSVPNVPMITSKEDANIEVGAGLRDISIKGSSAINEKKAILASSSFSYGTFSRYDNIFTAIGKNDLDIENGESKYKIWQGECAFGNYYPHKYNRNFEIYGGAGYAYATSETNQKLQTGTVFLQSNYGMKMNHFMVAITYKLSYNHFFYDEYHLSGYHTHINFPGITNLVAFTTKAGSENIKFWVSPGIEYTYLFVDSDNNEYGFSPNDFSNRLNLAVGLSYNFTKKRDR